MPSRIAIPDDLLERFQAQGFALVALPSSAQAIIDATLAAAQFFFRSAREEKLKGCLPNDLGYRGFEEEYSLSSDRRDQMESFSASLKGVHFAASLSTGLPLLLYMRMLATINVFEPIAEAAAIQVARDLVGGGVSQPLEGAFRWWSFLQLNYSFPSRVTTDYINDLHEDGCLITVAVASAPGLEVQLASSGEVISITTAPNEALIMPGEILWLLTGGAVKPLYHRVIPNRSYAERASLQYFGDISPELCRPWIVNDVNDGIDIGDRVMKNPTRFGLEAWTPSSRGFW